MNKKSKNITNLYDHFKNTPKKLKIVCDWDEVIQTHEPYALWKAIAEVKSLDISSVKRGDELAVFQNVLNIFWSKENCPIEYSSYGSKIREGKWIKEEDKSGYFFYGKENDEVDTFINDNLSPEAVEKQIQIKNSPNFYQQAPFLTIAEDLLKLIREDKVEKLIFLSAYDKRKFPNGDQRKLNIVWNTFGMTDIAEEKQKKVSLQLIPFDSENQGQSKADWIKHNASDFDIVIDDNPLICRSMVEMTHKASASSIKLCPGCEVRVELGATIAPCKNCIWLEMKIIAPYYPAIAEKHDKRVLLVKQEVSDLKKEEFK